MAAFRIAGGLLLFSIASEMVLGLRIARDARAAKQALDENIHDPAAFPLAIPLMAGPGAIAATLLLAGRAQGDFFSLALLIAAIGLVALICFGVCLAATRIERALGASAPWCWPRCSACCCRRSPCNMSSTARERVFTG